MRARTRPARERYLHRTLGVTVASTHPVPGLRRLAAAPPWHPGRPAPPGIRIRWHDPREEAFEPPLRGGPWRVHPWRDAQGHPLLQIHRDAEGAYRLRYADAVAFRVALDGSRIAVRRPPSYTLADAAAYLVGPVLGFARRLQGATTLHAAAVVVRGRAVALLGGPGAGKSTLTGALTRRGHRALCDDAACLRLGPGPVAVEPGAVHVRLWEDAATHLLGDPGRAPQVSPTWSKRALDLEAEHRHAAAPAPLAAVILLDPEGRGRAPGLSAPLPPAEALMALVRHGYGALLQDPAMRAAELSRLARVAERIPVRRLARGRGGLAGLGALCEAVEGCAVHPGRRLPAPASPQAAAP